MPKLDICVVVTLSNAIDVNLAISIKAVLLMEGCLDLCYNYENVITTENEDLMDSNLRAKLFNKALTFCASKLEENSKLNIAIFDISGGDAANDSLDNINYELIKKYKIPIFGYSDLTTVLNSVYNETKISTYHFQLSHVLRSNKTLKYFTEYFLRETQTNECITEKTLCSDNINDFAKFSYEIIQYGNLSINQKVEGHLLGGNIRCLLKLAGTKHMPEFKKDETFLLLESNSGNKYRILSLLNQIKQIGIFDNVKGILLGTFTELDRSDGKYFIENLVKRTIQNKELAIFRTMDIGHSPESKLIKIGGKVIFTTSIVPKEDNTGNENDDDGITDDYYKQIKQKKDNLLIGYTI